MCAAPDETDATSTTESTIEAQPLGLLLALSVLVLIAALAGAATVAFLRFMPVESPMSVRAEHVALAGVAIGALGPVLDFASTATGRSSPGRSLVCASLVLSGTMIAVVGAFIAIAAN